MAAGKYTEWMTEDGLELLKALAQRGLELGEIAQEIGVSASTLREWRKKYPAISAALSRGRAHARGIAENTLFKRAIGYTVDLLKPVKVKVIDYDPQTQRRVREREEIREAIEQQHFPPDTTALTFYLTNVAPEAWKRNPVEVVEIDENERPAGVIILQEATEGGEPPAEIAGTE